MTLRKQPPAYSPLALRNVLLGWISLLKNEPKHASHLKELISSTFDPTEVLLTDSGTSALSLALTATMLARKRRLVALPGYGCYDIATAADAANASVILYDVDPLTLGPDIVSLQRALDHEPAALVVAHLYGIPADLEKVMDACRSHDVRVIEDAAQGLGASYADRALGTFGDLSILSFGRGKGLTGGGGGALLVHNPDMRADALASLSSDRRGTRELLQATAQLLLSSPYTYNIPASLPFLRLGETIYRDPSPPSALPPAVARVIASAWQSALKESSHRRQTADHIEASISSSDMVQSIKPPANGQPGFLRFPIVASEGSEPYLASAAARRLGVMRGYPQTLANLAGFTARCIAPDTDLPGAQLLASRLFTAPTHSRLSSSDLGAICSLLTEKPH